MIKYGTTVGSVKWDEYAHRVTSYPDPEPPDSDPQWRLVSSVITEARSSESTILWFWRKEDNELPAKGEVGL